jgi:hypothetical protein
MGQNHEIVSSYVDAHNKLIAAYRNARPAPDPELNDARRVFSQAARAYIDDLTASGYPGPTGLDIWAQRESEAAARDGG